MEFRHSPWIIFDTTNPIQVPRWHFGMLDRRSRQVWWGLTGPRFYTPPCGNVSPAGFRCIFFCRSWYGKKNTIYNMYISQKPVRIILGVCFLVNLHQNVLHMYRSYYACMTCPMRPKILSVTWIIRVMIFLKNMFFCCGSWLIRYVAARSCIMNLTQKAL